ncbi:MAG: DNA methyltransferase [Gammaproteobacteria bacterium]|nr:DNA methyltransferase [Gammaproteobacteria bacterium]
MNSETVDLIYLDPPFNSNHNYNAPHGSQAQDAEFKDTWGLDDIDVAWHGYIAEKHSALHTLLSAAKEVQGESNFAYLIYMAMRILQMKRVLKPNGSIYLHCDPTMSHYLKLVMDAIFEGKNFRNEIVWHYQTGGASKKRYSRKHDHLLFYTNSNRYEFHPERIRMDRTEKAMARAKNPKGARISKDDATKLPMDVWADIQALNPMEMERTGYPTQKPLALLKRIIKASTNEGDLVLDPFCGCATACVAAEHLGRKWIGIDISVIAGKLVKQRFKNELGIFYSMKGVVHKPPTRDQADKKTDEVELFGDVKSLRYGHSKTKYVLWYEQKGMCLGCLNTPDISYMDVDHIVPDSRGGSHHISNLQVLCRTCNQSKGSRTMDEWLADKKVLNHYLSLVCRRN